MVRELREMSVEVRRVEGLESFAAAPMELYAAASRQAVVGGVPHQGMGEAHAANRAVNLRYDARVDALVEQFEKGVELESADSRQRLEIELAAQHRGQAEQPVALVREMAQAAADHLSHALRDCERPRCRLTQASLRREQTHDLPDEERVALGLGMHGGAQFRCGPVRGGELDEAGDVCLVRGR